MMKEYIDILKSIFDPIAVFLKDEEFVVVVKDEKDLQKAVSELSKKIEDEISLVILSKDEYEKMNEKDLGEKVL
jgi:PHD/YefM family antitoxin component YafN of YafNO toxin-antitoxin module